VTSRFTPIVQAYVTRDYQCKRIFPILRLLLIICPENLASEIIRGEFESDPIWEQDLNEVEEVTKWNFVEDDANGAFRIEPATNV
jgi:hypothetical protein